MRLSLSLPVAAAAALTACDSRQPPSAPPQAAATPLVQNAALLGMAAHLPADTEFYFGSANLKSHREALLKTRFWRRMQVFIQDQQPARGGDAASSKSGEILLDDVFISLGAGSARSLGWAQEMNRLYSEYSWLMLMAGQSGSGALGAFDLNLILANAARHPELLDHLCAVLERVEVPPLMVGVCTDDPAALLKQVIDPASPPAWLAQARRGTIKTGLGDAFTTWEATVGLWLTEPLRKEWLDALSKAGADDAVRARIQRTLEVLAAKPLFLATGSVRGFAVMAAGSRVAQLRLADAAEQSLLTRAELGVAAAHVERGVAGIFFAEAGLMDALADRQTLTPMLRGAVNGLTSVPTFAPLAQSLRPRVEDIARVEARMNQQRYATGAGVLWWDAGLHGEMVGGVEPDGDHWEKPPKFAHLLEVPGLLLGIDSHATPGGGREMFEQIMLLMHTAAGGLVQAGLGGEQVVAIYKLADATLAPALVRMYEASKTLYQEGLGSETAIFVDAGGAMPPLPLLGDGGGAKLPLVRLAAVHDIRNRALVGACWDRMQKALEDGFKGVPLLPISLPQPMSNPSGSFTSWFYPTALGSTDLLPCVTLSDDVYILGSSGSLNEELAARLQKTAPAPAPPGLHLRLSMGAWRRLLKDLGGTAIPGMKPGDAQTVLPWIAPLGDLRGRQWREAGVLHTRFSWEMHDLPVEPD